MVIKIKELQLGKALRRKSYSQH